MKSYTDIEQSKKLAEILPIESADMYYQYVLPKSDKIKHTPENGNPEEAFEWYNKGYTHFGKEPLSLKEYCIPCWSLAALLDIIPSIAEYNGMLIRLRIDKSEVDYAMWYDDIQTNLSTGIEAGANNFAGACYEMILKLHELKMLWL